MSSHDFTVEFGRIARTLEYEDAQGRLIFTVDLGSGGDKSLCLEHWPSRLQTVPRYSLAFERTKAYLASCGYSVEVLGEVAPALSLTSADVVRLVDSELNRQVPSANSPFDISRCLVAPTILEFRSVPDDGPWQLWLVFEEPRHRLRIVFDERTKQFGVAQGDIFEGFYGTFLQTLEAVSKVA